LRGFRSDCGTPPLIVFARYAFQTTNNTRTISVGGVDVEDAELTDGGGTFFCWHVYNTGPQNVTVDMPDDGNQNQLGSVFLAVA
jgi:hypothetical protein